jgi:hypothetical protein
MKRLLTVLVPAILVIAFAASAAAQQDGSGRYDDLLQSMYVPPDWDQLGAGGANVNSCTAWASLGNTCIDCVASVDPRVGQPTTPSCQQVTYSASCNCDSGKCSGGKSGAVSGSCTYNR